MLYDEHAGRWLMSQFALPNFPRGPFYQCIAISQTGDPLGAYHRYQFSFNKLNDYPKFGVWADGYYMSINQFTCNIFGSCQWAGEGVAAFPRTEMLAGAPASMVYFDMASADTSLGGMLPSDLDGPLPPAGTPNYARACIPQGSSTKLDAISDRVMYRLQYRNFGSYQTLVTNHSVDVTGTDQAGVRWYEIRINGGTPSIYQQGTFAPDTNHRWMGSAAMDSAGNIAIGYNVSNVQMFPRISFTAAKRAIRSDR